MATVELKGTEWKEFSKADYAIIDCYGYNCTACVMLEPVFNAAADGFSGISFGRVNIMENGDIAENFGNTAMPTLLYFRKGELIDQTIGNLSKEDLIAQISKLLYS